ncbi:hypothetical protein IT397_03580 [Candidatus Nomurabacteria bacterium]|nr:hypothetical protein [Candidatus Nomurabacteria bacterium]
MNRKDLPALPDWAECWIYPDLQDKGPPEFVFSFRREEGRHLNLQDGLAIQKMPHLFLRWFGEREVPLANSVVKSRFGENLFYVPVLCYSEKEKNVSLEWLLLESGWEAIFPVVGSICRRAEDDES